MIHMIQKKFLKRAIVPGLFFTETALQDLS
jgi:hypothetical protein